VRDILTFFPDEVPQIFQLYWSVPQVEARQHPNMSKVRSFINRCWSFETINQQGERIWSFDPDKETTYADRLRMRTPGNVSGLKPHVDGGSIERWIEESYQKVYRKIFEGKWEEYDPFDAQYRAEASEFPSENVSTVFRSYQGWLAITDQGPNDGTLQVVPLVKHAISYLLMRPFMVNDHENDPFCGAFYGKQHTILPKYFAPLLQALITIPHVEAGDTVWWHPDLIHAVETKHEGKEEANVFYIGALPLCVKNAKYLTLQMHSFQKGESPPDFPPLHFESIYQNRATIDNLSVLGSCQMGFKEWQINGDDDPSRKHVVQLCNSYLGT